MGKNKLANALKESDIAGAVVLNNEAQVYSVPKVKATKPVGSQVLLEILHSQELMNTTLQLSADTTPKVALQAYVRAVGPAVKLADWGFDIGDRVLISGSGVMVPRYEGMPNAHRDSFLMEPHSIRGVIAEEGKNE